MPTPRTVAVLICVYRGDSVDRFRSAMDSVFAQKSDDIAVAIYLCQDGPVSEEISLAISSYRERLACFVMNPQSLGLACSLNVLISRLGNEPYIARMDSDDECLPDRFCKQIEYLENNSSIDACGGAILERYTASGRVVERRFPSQEQINQSVCRGVPIAHPTAFFRADFFKKYGLYPESEFNQDLGLWFRALSKGAYLGNIADPVLIFNVESGFASRRGKRKAFDEFSQYFRGILLLNRPKWELIYPCLRLACRLLPRPAVMWIYELGLFRNGPSAVIR